MYFHQRRSNKHQGNHWHQTWSCLIRTYTFIEFWGYGVEKAYLISKHPHIYENKGISIIDIKRIHEYHQEKKINISSKQYWWEYHECRAPTKALIDFAWVGSMNSIIWNHEVYSCLEKIKKITKIVKNKRKQWKCIPEVKRQQIAC